jgi:small subunit ribosomal protein S18
VTAKISRRARRTARLGVKPRKKNPFAGLGLSAVDYKDTAALRMFISERGKIRSRDVTGLTRSYGVFER